MNLSKQFDCTFPEAHEPSTGSIHCVLGCLELQVLRRLARKHIGA